MSDEIEQIVKILNVITFANKHVFVTDFVVRRVRLSVF